ncbi:MAG: hypothetical protein NWR14_05360, partial [Flavobacteriaceae bacterium]|nr:hypothetical protein [Flavobacteriaceae bacterium]
MKRFLLSFVAALSFVFSNAQTTSFYDLNVAADIAANFYTSTVTTSGYPQHLSSGGINNSGYLSTNDSSSSLTVRKVYISKQGYTNPGVGNKATFSIFFKSNGVGYGGLGFQIPNAGTNTLETTAHATYARSTGKVLGISFHGNGYIWHD